MKKWIDFSLKNSVAILVLTVLVVASRFTIDEYDKVGNLPRRGGSNPSDTSELSEPFLRRSGEGYHAANRGSS
ncbi:hypothetical protein QTG56_11115 [Rossellomorea sp. AcN35-11]|nr:hypothetical protein QTG56_11115 [Rossellomorea sp. AcN35-11]